MYMLPYLGVGGDGEPLGFIMISTDSHCCCSLLGFWPMAHVNTVPHSHRWSRVMVVAFLTPSLGGISNRAVCSSKESLQRTVDPLYLPRPQVPQHTGKTHYHRVRRETHPHSSSQGVCISLLFANLFLLYPHSLCWRLHIQTLQRSSPHLCQLFLCSIFIETEINIQQGSLYCDSFSDNGPFIWEQVKNWSG